MKTVTLFLLLAALVFSSVPIALAEEETKNAPTALEFVRMMGNGINLGNTLEACDANKGRFSENTADYETLWGQPVTTPAMLQGLKAAGFDTLRVPVAWMTNATHLSEGDYTIDEAFIARVQQIVDDALEAGLYVILNDHWDGGWYGMFGSDTKETRALAMEA